MKIDQQLKMEVVQALSEKLRTTYVFPDIAVQICDRLENHLEEGDYADISDGDFFAYALTQHIQEINQDEHIWVRWHPESLPDEEETLRLNQDWVAEQTQTAVLDNYGIHKVERIPGHVGYP